MTEIPEKTSLLCFPMHGQRKLIAEGYRTRDGHFIEWFGRLLQPSGPVSVISRPEPALDIRSSSTAGRSAENTVSIEPRSRRIPNLMDRRRWWVDSARAYPSLQGIPDTVPAVVWNPFVTSAKDGSDPLRGNRSTVLDLLDDWTFHFAFQSIKKEVETAYARAFESATYVTANAEGTADLARRFGRDDVVLLPNGVDPERFSTTSRASGPLTVGYVGKIGRRLNLELITTAAASLPDVHFVFAGPILDAEYRKPLEAASNITLLGDVHYDKVPELLETFDVGWVPHNVGDGEVGGDVIKTYEYRAAGLPVLTTPIGGVTKRGLDHVNVLEPTAHVGWLSTLVGRGDRVTREVSPIPTSATWQQKAERILGLLGIAHG
jgi:glycosyltransferase involved in cell wall biosynthesis